MWDQETLPAPPLPAPVRWRPACSCWWGVGTAKGPSRQWVSWVCGARGGAGYVDPAPTVAASMQASADLLRGLLSMMRGGAGWVGRLLTGGPGSGGGGGGVLLAGLVGCGLMELLSLVWEAQADKGLRDQAVGPSCWPGSLGCGVLLSVKGIGRGIPWESCPHTGAQMTA